MVTPFTRRRLRRPRRSAPRLATHLVDHGHDGLVISGTTGESPTVDPAEQRAAPAHRRRGGRRPGQRRRRRRAPTTPPTRSSSPAPQPSVRRRRPAGRHAVLQQAAAGGHRRALQGDRRLHRAAGDALRHPRPRRHSSSQPTRSPARPSTRGSSRSRRPAATCTPARGCCDRPTWSIYSGDDALNLAWLALGAVGVVSVVGHVAGRQHAAMVAAVDAGDLATARQIDSDLLPARRRDHEPGTRAPSWPRPHSSCTACCPTASSALPLLAATDEQVERSLSATTLSLHGHTMSGGRHRMSHPHPELGAPPALPPHGLRVIPLGGLGEVGRNMAVLEHRRPAARSSTAACCSPTRTSPAST